MDNNLRIIRGLYKNFCKEFPQNKIRIRRIKVKRKGKYIYKIYIRELKRIREASKVVLRAGLKLHAGHGLHYQNTRPIARITGMRELNIGHSIISRAVEVGISSAVREMKQLLS